MITYQYTQKDWTTFKEGIKREWAVTNGIGGYAGSSMIGAHSRTHQGYLIASLHAPIERYLVFSKINETATVGTSTVSFETSQHCASGKTVYTEGQKFLTSFIYDGSVHYTYETDNFSFEKHITLKRNANVCAVSYELTAGDSDCTFTLTPLFNYREHSESSTPDTLRFDTFTEDRTFYLVPEKNKDIAIRFQTSEGTFSERETVYDIDMQLQIEVDLETDGLDCHYCPVDLSIAVPANTTKKVSILCSIGDVNERPAPVSATEAFSILEENARCHAELFEKAGYHDSFANQLVLASDQFLTYRESTKMMTVLAGLPWFTDWGRDTMIAFTGLTLCTKRFKAEEILLTFARYIRHGIVPNMFPDDNMPPLYNTVDASLWYFYAVYQYLHYNPAAEAEAFVKEQIFPHLKEIISAYEKGTDFSIYMEDDGLIHAGSGLDQITWMDVRVGDWVATPRHGKPVEINALWYNALRIMESLCEKFDEDASAYRTRAEQVKESFNAKFWDSANQCLFDVVDGDEPDDHIRPNQIYAVSLPFSLLPEEQEKAVVALVEKELFVGCGLRSLAPDHPDYHGIYCGALAKRDAAYHQGTAWGFLLGGFFSAYMKVNHHSSSAVENAVHMLEPVRKHLSDSGCIGSISEIFDGDTPHNPRGCYAQAWSVGEVLRCYCEDILPYL